jgi:muramoyltetrapeptide carboxypeptidase
MMIDSTLPIQTLKPGDVVAVIAPSYGAEEGLLEKVRSFLASWGLIMKVSLDIFGENLLYANSDEKRFETLVDALHDEETKVIWCLQGGAGAKRLIPLLEKIQKPRIEKIFIGLSDITALHTFFHQEWQWTPLHASPLRRLARGKFEPWAVDELREVLFGFKKEVQFDGLIPLNPQAQKIDQITSPLVGGNLAVLQYSLGTSWQIHTNGKMLLLEDVNEKPYRVAEYLEHFRQAKAFEGLKALLLADFTYDTPEQDQNALLQAVFRKFASEVQFPVFRMTNVGHGPVSRPFMIGSPAILNGQEQTLICSFPTVS